MSSFLSVAKKLSATALSQQSPARSHRARDAGLRARLAERQRHELGPLVGVMDQPGLGPALRDGHVQRVDDEV